MKYNVSVDGVSLEALLDKLGGIAGAKRFLAGNVEVVIKDHIIDCNVDPFLEQGWKVESHLKQGERKLTRDGATLLLDGKRIDLYLSKKQEGSGVIVGNDLRKELEGKNVLNANVGRYLYEHPELVPDEWKGKAIFFWGTIYRNSDGYLYVRCLYWRGGRWNWLYSWLGRGWGVIDPAAVLAS